MGTFCLSPTPALRCVGLSLIEEAITLIPSALEVVFSLGLIFSESDAGRIRYILAAEGPIYLLLAVLSLLNRIIPLFEYSLEAHKILDITIGAATFLPLLLYTFYLYLLKRKEFFPELPRRFTLVAKTFALVLIPVIIVTNEIVSFLGISYRHVPDPESRIVGNQAAVGPYYTSFQFGREFLRSISLALLFIYQAITFLMFFLRLASCILAQRGIEYRAAAEREGVLFRGIGWLTIGVKLSTIETAIGFASTSFGTILTRRILRMFGRACIIIGVVKGLDRKEEFLILDSEKDNEFLSGTRKLRLSARQSGISAPRLVQSSMSQRISRMASLRPSLATFAAPYPVSPRMSDAERTPFVTQDSSDVPPDWPTDTHTSVATMKSRPPPLHLERFSSESHVSVVRGLNSAPTLVLNLSPMDLRSSDIIAATMSGRSQNQTSTSTIDYVEMTPGPFLSPVPRSAPLPLPRLITDMPPGIPSSSSANESSRTPNILIRPPPRRSSRLKSMPYGVPPLPINPSRASAPAPPASYAWPTIEQGTVESEQASGTPTRSRIEESQSTLGGILIDWITPEGAGGGGGISGGGGGGGVGDGRPGVARIKSVGAAPRRTTPNPTSAGAVRNSVVLERHETVAGTTRTRRHQSRRETARKDSGVLGVDDPALLRRSSPRPHDPMHGV